MVEYLILLHNYIDFFRLLRHLSSLYCTVFFQVTKLVRNYRCNGALLSVPSRLFYDNELLVAGDGIINCMCEWEVLPNKKMPIIFHGMRVSDIFGMSLSFNISCF